MHCRLGGTVDRQAELFEPSRGFQRSSRGDALPLRLIQNNATAVTLELAASLKIGLDVFKSDVAFALFGVVFPFSSVAVLILVFVAALLIVFRFISGRKIG